MFGSKTSEGNSFDDFEFKKLYDEERRKSEHEKIREKYPNRIPVIVAKVNDRNSQSLPDLDQNKFLIPDEFNFQQLQGMVRKRLQLSPSQVIYLIFRSNRMYGGDRSVTTIYEEEKDADGFLYIKYSGQEYTGSVKY
eukprot:TRINITY_DN3204_c0_g1_i3.p3 TRINITY_DN3204_c0_g1~~TRINITY_DN3204_c0_g1_i3.p3  ORF type:complete len:137 (+),score=45.63 TRINITY_DN3204_c0_g1_i3:113-523(+)